MLAIGRGWLTVAKNIVGEEIKLETPELFNIELTGSLKPGFCAKYIALEALMDS